MGAEDLLAQSCISAGYRHEHQDITDLHDTEELGTTAHAQKACLGKGVHPSERQREYVRATQLNLRMALQSCRRLARLYPLLHEKLPQVYCQVAHTRLISASSS